MKIDFVKKTTACVMLVYEKIVSKKTKALLDQLSN